MAICQSPNKPLAQLERSGCSSPRWLAASCNTIWRQRKRTSSVHAACSSFALTLAGFCKGVLRNELAVASRIGTAEVLVSSRTCTHAHCLLSMSHDAVAHVGEKHVPWWPQSGHPVPKSSFVKAATSQDHGWHVATPSLCFKRGGLECIAAFILATELRSEIILVCVIAVSLGSHHPPAWGNFALHGP